MSKGLELLKKFDKLVKTYHEKIGLNENDLLGFSLSLKIIEKELKSHEEYVKIAEKEHEELMYVQKKLKALEIIKSKPWLVNDVVESKGKYDVYKSWCNTFRTDMKYRATQEEYELLKEVLL